MLVATDCRRELQAQGLNALAKHPALPHAWHETGDSLALEFPATAQDGFGLKIVARGEAIELYAGGFQTHFDDSLPPARLVTAALGLARDLLSPAMRLRELQAGGAPYRWFIQRQVDGTWQSEEEFGILIWNYLGHRSEALYQNRQLPSRKGAA